jgi:hypothetical protein
MKPSYNAHQQKIYDDYFREPDSELQKILDNKENYRNEVIAVVGDIMNERGPNPVNYALESYIIERLYEYDKTKEKVVEEIQKKFNVTAEESSEAVERVLENKKEEVLIKFPYKVKFDDDAILIVVGMFISSILDRFILHYGSLRELNVTFFYSFTYIYLAIMLTGAVYCGIKSYKLNRDIIVWMIFGLCTPMLSVLVISCMRPKHPRAIRNFIKVLEEDYRRKVRNVINRESIEDRKSKVAEVFANLEYLYEKMIVNYYVYKQTPDEQDISLLTPRMGEKYKLRFPNLIIVLALVISSILIFSFVESVIPSIAAFVVMALYSTWMLSGKFLLKGYHAKFRQYEVVGFVLLGYTFLLLIYSWLFNIYYLYGVSLFLFGSILIPLTLGYAIIAYWEFIGIDLMKIINDGKLYIFSRVEIIYIMLCFYFVFISSVGCILRLSSRMEGRHYFYKLSEILSYLPGRQFAFLYLVIFAWAAAILYARRRHGTYLRVLLTSCALILLSFLIQFNTHLIYKEESIKKSMIQEEVKTQSTFPEIPGK